MCKLRYIHRVKGQVKKDQDIKLVNKDFDLVDRPYYIIRGFLCVDSPKEGHFNSTFDVDIMKGVCDGLYNQIDLIYKLNQQKRN